MCGLLSRYVFCGGYKGITMATRRMFCNMLSLNCEDVPWFVGRQQALACSAPCQQSFLLSCSCDVRAVALSAISSLTHDARAKHQSHKELLSTRYCVIVFSGLGFLKPSILPNLAHLHATTIPCVCTGLYEGMRL